MIFFNWKYLAHIGTYQDRILVLLTTFMQVSARIEKNNALVLGLEECLIECATVCVESVVILIKFIYYFLFVYLLLLHFFIIFRYNVPALQAVGWEGTFGFLTLATLLIPFYFIPVGDKFGNNPRHVLEDAYDGLYQLAHNWRLGKL